jgi:hypothetical protein
MQANSHTLAFTTKYAFEETGNRMFESEWPVESVSPAAMAWLLCLHLHGTLQFPNLTCTTAVGNYRKIAGFYLQETGIWWT